MDSHPSDDPVVIEAASLVLPYLFVRHPPTDRNFNVVSDEKLETVATNFYGSALEKITGELGNDLVEEFLKQDALTRKNFEIGVKLDIDIYNINKMTIPQLKAFLSSHGLKKGGTKPILITRVKNYIENLALKGDDPVSDSISCSSEGSTEQEVEAEMEAETKTVAIEEPVAKVPPLEMADSPHLKHLTKKDIWGKIRDMSENSPLKGSVKIPTEPLPSIAIKPSVVPKHEPSRTKKVFLVQTPEGPRIAIHLPPKPEQSGPKPGSELFGVGTGSLKPTVDPKPEPSSKVTAHLIQTPQGPRILMQGIQAPNLPKDQQKIFNQQIVDKFLKAQAEAKLQGKLPPTKITIDLPFKPKNAGQIVLPCEPLSCTVIKPSVDSKPEASSQVKAQLIQNQIKRLGIQSANLSKDQLIRKGDDSLKVQAEAKIQEKVPPTEPLKTPALMRPPVDEFENSSATEPDFGGKIDTKENENVEIYQHPLRDLQVTIDSVTKELVSSPSKELVDYLNLTQFTLKELIDLGIFVKKSENQKLGGRGHTNIHATPSQNPNPSGSPQVGSQKKSARITDFFQKAPRLS